LISDDEEDAIEDLYPEVLEAAWGASLTFTDSTISPGATVVKKVHVSELRSRVNAQRLRFGLSTYTWTDPDPVVGSTPVAAVHISQLRTALGAAYTAHGLSAPSYTDTTLTAQSTVIKAIHINELRAAVVYLEQH
jgi:hypothetical protein